MPSFIEPLDHFFMFEGGSRGEGRATGREERAGGREIQTDGWMERGFLPLSVSSLAVYTVVRFSMSFKHTLQPVSTSVFLGLSSSLVVLLKLSTYLFVVCLFVVPFPPFPPCLCFPPPPHPSCLPSVVPQVSNFSFIQVKLMPCHLAMTRSLLSIWTVFSQILCTESYFAFITFCF